MAPKRREVQASSAAAPAASASASTVKPVTVSSPASKSTASTSANASATDIVLNIWENYTTTTPQRTLLLDTFMAFLVL
ncbi:hypothetical protein FQN49_007437, partial [Arthroderma sp. PD_2]